MYNYYIYLCNFTVPNSFMAFMDGGFLLGRFVIDDKIGCIVDQLDELPTIHFSDRIDFFSLNEFLNRQESRIDRYKSYINDPFEPINDQFQCLLGCNFEEFVAKHHIVFTSFEQQMDMCHNIEYYHTTNSYFPTAIMPRSSSGTIILKGSFIM